MCPNFDIWVPTGANFSCIFIGFTKNAVFARSFLLGVFPNFHIGVPRSAGLCVSIGRLTFAEIIFPIAGRPIMTSHEDAWILLTISRAPDHDNVSNEHLWKKAESVAFRIHLKNE